jgi:isopenicillin-N N-acyltransferase like protein
MFEVLDITGLPYERGKKYGEKKKKEIKHFIEYIYGNEKIKKNDILAYVKKYINYIENYSEVIFQEMQGVAKGADILLEEIVMISMHEEKSGFSKHNCTSFAVSDSVSLTGATYIGQTWDIDFILCKEANPFLLIFRQEKGPDFLSFTYPGMIAGAGINTDGISLVWNSVPRLKLKTGVPTYVIIEEVLRQKTIGAALAAVMRAERAGCFNFLIADKTEIYDIEATPFDLNIDYSEKYIGHANHYVSEKFRDRQDITAIGKKFDASSIIRHNRINRLLKENEGKIDLSMTMDFMKDHVNYPHSICRHAAMKGEGSIMTCASFTMIPAQGELWISKGPACENDFNKYVIEKKGDNK